jgi:hypothetical protein
VTYDIDGVTIELYFNDVEVALYRIGKGTGGKNTLKCQHQTH